MAEYDDTDYSGYGNLSSADLYNLFSNDPTIDYSGYGNLTGPDLAKLAADMASNAGTSGLGLKDLANLAKRLMSGKGSASEYGNLASILAGLYGANRSSGPTILNPGYRGGIPQATATRTMLTQPPAGRRPGSGGINYGGDVTYARTGQNLSAENAGISTPVSQPLGGTSTFTQPSSYDLPSLLALIQQLQGAGLGGPGRPSAPSPTSGTPTPGTPAPSPTVVGRPPASTPAPTPSAPVAGGQSGLNLYEPGYEKRFGSTPPGSFVVGGDGRRTPEELKAEYEKNVRETALGGARYLQDLYNYQPTGKSSFGDLYTRALADPSLIGRRSDESMEDALLRLKANIKDAEDRQARREELRAQFEGQGGNPFVISGLQYGTDMTDPYMGASLGTALENMRRIQAQNPQFKDLQSVISSITGTPFSTPEYAFPAPPGGIADETGFVPKKPDLQQISQATVPVAPTSPGTGGPGATPSGGGIQDLFQQIYGRAGSESEVKNIAGLSPDQARNVLETSLANWKASQQPMHTAQPQGLPLLAAPQQKFEMVPPGEGDYRVEAAKGGLLPDGFVVPADVVSHLGNGSSEAGLKILASKFGARPIKGDGDGMSDSIPTTIGGEQPARVANEEAFIPPSVVKRLGNGDTDRGAKKLYAMMDRIRKARTGTTEQGKEINPEKFMPGGKVNRYQTGGNITTNPSAGLASSSLAEWSGPYVADLLSKGQALTEAPYQAYTGPLTAGASPLQQMAFGASTMFRPSSDISQAAGTAAGIAALAPNLRYTPQTTDFLGRANVSGIDVSPSYGMMAQAPSTFQTRPFPVRDSAQQFQQGRFPDRLAQKEADRQMQNITWEDPNSSIQRIPGTMDFYHKDPITGRITRGTDSLAQTYSNTGMSFIPEDISRPAPFAAPQRTNKLPPGYPGAEPVIMDGDGMYVPPSGQYMSDQLRGLPAALTPPAQGGNIAQQYMNPYLQAALDPQLRELTRQSDIQRGADAARLAKAGAFGGSRQAIMEAEGRRNLLEKQSDVLGQGYATAYDKAMAQFNADQARRAQEAQFGATYGMEGLRTGLQAAQTQGNLGGLQTQYGLEGIRQLADLGRTQRDIEAEGIAADKAQFEEARLNPFKMLQFQQSLLTGLPLASQSLYQPGQSNLQQFASGATTVQSLLKALGLIK